MNKEHLYDLMLVVLLISGIIVIASKSIDLMQDNLILKEQYNTCAQSKRDSI